MIEKDEIMEIPPEQRMERRESIAREHSQEYKAALWRAVVLDVPQAYSPSAYGTFQEMEGENSSRSSKGISSYSKNTKKSWDGFVERLFDVDESGDMVFKKQ